MNKFYFISVLFLAGCSHSVLQGASRVPAADQQVPPLKGNVDLLVTPDMDTHAAFIDRIDHSSSGHSIRLVMYHLTDSKVVDSLIAAKRRGADVRVILDRSSLKQGKFHKSFQRLLDAGVLVKESPVAFSITHQKTMVVDESEVFITAINLTNNADSTRDFGLIVHDSSVIKEVIQVFEADWQNADSSDQFTPPVSEPHLVWSPVNSQDKLVSLIDSAHLKIISTVENLGDLKIQAAFGRAIKRGVGVRLIVPMCDKNKNPLLNYPFLTALQGAGVESRVMPYPENTQQPYMHSKMIEVDGTTGYVGSVNFSPHSTLTARELGILFTEQKPLQKISEDFEADWLVSIPPPNKLPNSCPVVE